MTDTASRHQMLIIAACGLIAAAALFPGAPVAVLRFSAIAALIGQIGVESRARSTLFLTSPPFLLAAMALVFYSFLQGFIATDAIGGFNPLILLYIGSDAERYIVAFAMAAIAVHGVVCRRPSRPSGAAAMRSDKAFLQGNGTFALAVTVSLALTLANIAIYRMDGEGAASLGFVRTATPPLLALLMIHLVRSAADGGRGLRTLAGAVFMVTVAGLLAVHEGKIPIFMALAGWLYWLRLKNVALGKVLFSGVVFALLGIALIQVVQVIRVPAFSVAITEHQRFDEKNAFWRLFLSKAVWRQTETGYCLNNVVKEHWQQPFQASKQLFWLKGLVPRILWPEKPNLSKGGDYSVEYCGFAARGTHSASITLLGQPVIQGGWVGLLVHGGLLLAGLGGLAWLTRTPHGLSSAVVVALLPWWIDFDQDFVLYVANMVKFFLIMLPMLFILVVVGKNRKDETA